MAVLRENPSSATEQADLWVDEGYGRKGLGEKLLRAAIEDMKRLFAKHDLALRKVLVTTGEDNEPAKRLYRKIGFHKSAVLKDLFALGENELIYVLTLNP